MNSMNGTVDKIFFAVVITAALFIFSMPISRRSGWKKWIFFACAAAAIVLFCWLADLLTSLIYTTSMALVLNNVFDILFSAACLFMLLLVYRYTVKDGLFVYCASYAAACGADSLYRLVWSNTVGPNGFLVLELSDWGRTFLDLGIDAVVSAAVLSVCYFLFVRREKSGYFVNNTIYLWIVLIFAANLFIGNFEDSGSGLVYIFIIQFLVNALVLFVLFALSRSIRIERENAKLQSFIDQQKAQYLVAKESIEHLNMAAHDIKHLAWMIREGGDGSPETVEKLEGSVRRYEFLYDTGNKALDIALSEKCRHFSDSGIDFTIIAEGDAVSFMSDLDIYILFGNLLENACEAAAEVGEEDSRVVGLYLKRKGNFITVHSENTMAEMPVFENGLPRTHKKDRENHGFGIRSITEIVKKYNGCCTMDCTGTMFSTDITFFANGEKA